MQAGKCRTPRDTRLFSCSGIRRGSRSRLREAHEGRRRRGPKAASKPNASLGKARLRIAAPQERQTSKKSPSSPESARPAAGEDRRAEGWRQSLPASEHSAGAEFASFVKLPVERLYPRLISMIPTSVLLVKHAKLCAVRAPGRRPNGHSLLHRGDDARPL